MKKQIVMTVQHTGGNGYLRDGVLSALNRMQRPHFSATVELPTGEQFKREFSWLYVVHNQKLTMANRTTGRLFDPATGESDETRIKVIDAPIVPEYTLGKSIFATSE